jgi:hypothetical protein
MNDERCCQYPSFVILLGYISDESAGSTIDVTAPKGTVVLNVRDWFSTLKLDRHVDQ